LLEEANSIGLFDLNMTSLQDDISLLPSPLAPKPIADLMSPSAKTYVHKALQLADENIKGRTQLQDVTNQRIPISPPSPAQSPTKTFLRILIVSDITYCLLK
jgi:hypothetical protein